MKLITGKSIKDDISVICNLLDKYHNAICENQEGQVMTKEDYMQLPKERLAELLEERDKQLPVIIPPFDSILPCYAPDGVCTNPQRDCINCPRTNMANGYWTITITLNKDDRKNNL